MTVRFSDEKEGLELDQINPQYYPLRQAIEKAYKSFNFAFDLGESGLRGLSLHVWSADGQIDCGVVGNISVNKLKQHCVPAPYGDLATNTTKVDPDVRSALTLDYDKIVIKKKIVPKKKTGSKKKPQKDDDDVPKEDLYKKAVQDLLQRVQDKFQDDTLYFEPYKLNMYEKGGFFKPHKDTPRYSNMVGTMVVVLKSSEGGDLIIRHGGESFFETGSATAFFCDREHEVTPVKSGTRVTLTFNICKASKSVAKTERAITLTRATPLVKENNVAALIKAIKESRFKKIGILTEFDYTQKGITLQTLKGSDRVLFEELSKERSFQIDLLPTVLTKHYTENRDDYSKTIDGKVYRFATEDLDRMMRQERAKEIPDEDHAVFFFHKLGLELYEHEQEGAEHTGNESLDHTIDNIYFNAAIVVTDLNPKSTKVVAKSKSGSGSNESMDE